jgi:hypothetical protein
MRKSGIFTLLVGLGLGIGPGLGGRASADEIIGPRRNVPPVSGAPMGMDAVRRGVQGPEGLVNARILLHVNASKGLFGKPVTLAPDLFYAVTDTLSVGLLHNLPMGILTRPGSLPLGGGPGLCLTGTTGGCPKVYDNLGLDLLYGLAFGDVHFSLHGSFYVLKFSDPTLLMLTLGAAAKFHFNRDVALFLDPQFGIALDHRSDLNKDQLFLPMELQFQLVRTTALDVLTGVTGRLSGFGDSYQIPLGLALVYNINPHWDVGAKFAFDNLLGHQPPGVSRTDLRSLALIINIRS